MQDNFSNNLSRNDRKVKQAGFIVLHQTFMPSVLIETGFLTNKSEGVYLNSKKGQEEMGNAIADAIINYKNNTRINLEDAASSREIVTATKTEETTPNEISTAMETEATPVPEVNDQVTKKEIKEPIAIVTTALPETETAEATPEKPAEGLTKEEVKEEVIEEPVKVVEEPIATPIADEKKEEVVKEEEIKKEEVVSDTKVVFKVQLLASSKVLPLLSEEFNGLSTLSTERHKNFIRYMYGKTNSYNQAKLYKANADAKGYTTSFIVAYKDGKRIPVPEALKYVSE